MTRSQIEYVLAVNQFKSFGKAAEHCHITQSTLSAMVAKFESQIGIIIFNRKTKPISTTEQGEAVLQKLKNIEREFITFDESISQLKGIQSGQLSMACIPTVAPYLFPSILGNLERSFPKVNFIIREITTSEIISNILSGKIDVGIVSTPLNHPEIIESPLYNEAFVLYDKRDNYSQSANNQIDINELDYNRLLLLEEGHCFRNQVVKICNLRQKKTVKSNITYTSGTIESLKNVVTVNKGITLLPYLSASVLAPTEKKHIKYFQPPVPVREIGLVHHKNFVKSSLANGIKELIKKQVEKRVNPSEMFEVIDPF